MQIKIIVFSFVILSYANASYTNCGEGCADCDCDLSVPYQELPEIECDCKKCEEGYFFKKYGDLGFIYLTQICTKLCKEGPNDNDCKICGQDNDRDECLECSIHAKLEDNECIPQSIKCGNKTFYDCEKCEEIISNTANATNTTNEKDYKCGACRYHFILSDGVCVYDNNFTRYSLNEYINKFNYFKLVYLCLIYLLFIN